jgi:alpha-tubulin suppressor-like RCC1 family protein
VSPGVFGGDYWTEASYNPAVVEELIDITDIAAGYNQTLVKKSDGTIRSVGMNYRGELGDGQALLMAPFATESFVESLVTGAMMQMDTFAGNTGFLKTDGTIWICGANSQNQVGTGGTSLYIDVPTLAVQGIGNASGYTVAFDLSGGVRTGGGALLQIVDEGQAAMAPEVMKTGTLFDSWDPPLTDIREDLTIKAFWRHELTIETDGRGSVVKTPDSPSYTDGTSVTLTAVPVDGWGFAEWTWGYDRVNPLVVQIPVSRPITAYFIRIGDVNWDNVINLADALAALQVVTGDTNTLAHPGAAVKSSGKIGIADAVYILQKTAELR